MRRVRTVGLWVDLLGFDGCLRGGGCIGLLIDVVYLRWS